MVMRNEGFTLVTGASKGIGRELARVCAEHHHNLVLVARSEDELSQLAGELRKEHAVTVEVLPADLGEPEAPERIRRRVVELDLPIDRLINNAGYGSLGAFHETSIDRQLDMLRVNIMALTHLTHLFIQPMIERGRGRILNVASTAGFQPGPLMAVYYATKAYVVSFSEALAEELRPTGVTVTVLCPGPTRTGFQRRAEMEGSRLTYVMADARSVAVAGYRAMERGRVVAVTGAFNRLGALLVRVTPRGLTRRVVKHLNRAG